MWDCKFQMSFEVLILVKFSFFVNKFKFIVILGLADKFANFNKQNFSKSNQIKLTAKKIVK